MTNCRFVVKRKPTPLGLEKKIGELLTGQNQIELYVLVRIRGLMVRLQFKNLKTVKYGSFFGFSLRSVRGLTSTCLKVFFARRLDFEEKFFNAPRTWLSMIVDPRQVRPSPKYVDPTYLCGQKLCSTILQEL